MPKIPPVEEEPVISPSTLVSKAYLLPWYSKKQNIVIKGSKGSGKSKFVSLWIIYEMMKPENAQANTLVVRQVYETLSQSCYVDLLWAIERLHVSHLWEHTRSPLRLVYKPTGQEIIFRGFDDPIKLASINVLHGYLCWIWFEEATQIDSYEDVEILLASIRAIPPESGVRKRFMYTFNPWSDQHWLKKKFFDKESPKTLAMTTTYRDNPYFTKDDRAFYEDLKASGSKLAPVICDGEWGIIEGLIYDNWEVEDFDVAEIADRMNIRFAYGLDFGYATSYTAFVAALVDPKSYDIWIYDQLYEKEMTNIDIAKRLTQMGYANERIIADCAEPKSIMELRGGFLEQNKDGSTVRYSIPNVVQARKGADSINNGISRIQMYKIHVLPRCKDVITELSCYSWEINKQGEYTGKPIKKFDHAMDALRYLMEPFLSLARGFVAEAKGIDGFAPKPKPTVAPLNNHSYHARRIYATHE